MEQQLLAWIVAGAYAVVLIFLVALICKKTPEVPEDAEDFDLEEELKE